MQAWRNGTKRADFHFNFRNTVLNLREKQHLGFSFQMTADVFWVCAFHWSGAIASQITLKLSSNTVHCKSLQTPDLYLSNRIWLPQLLLWGFHTSKRVGIHDFLRLYPLVIRKNLIFYAKSNACVGPTVHTSRTLVTLYLPTLNNGQFWNCLSVFVLLSTKKRKKKRKVLKLCYWADDNYFFWAFYSGWFYFI